MTRSPLSGSTTARTMARSATAILGMVDGRILYVAYTMRNDTIRIISARAAEPYERRRYHEDNA